MQISIFGLGYVGSVAAACLARDGHHVIGVDADPVKVDLINQGVSPIVEPDLRELICAGRENGKLEASTDPDYAVRNSEITFFCVGTPSRDNGSLDLDYVKRVCEQIGESIGRKTDFHLVVARRTMLPGTVRSLVIPTLERTSGKQAGRDFGVCVNPEFLREGTAIYDFDNPPKTVIGATDDRSAEILKRLCAHLKAPLVVTPVEVAEAVKYTDNCWHAVKVVFGNEIGAICNSVGVDAQAVMDVFCQDRKLNISPAYLKPGIAFGGSCLPKDVRAMSYFARSHDVDVPMLNSVLAANEKQIERMLHLIESKQQRKVGVLGISFKAGTDDLRESPVVRIVEALHGKGYEVMVYDPFVSVASVRGANRNYILKVIPHIRKMLTEDFQEFLDHSQTVVVGNRSLLFRGLMKKIPSDRTVVDLVNLIPAGRLHSNRAGAATRLRANNAAAC
jgi:GDP-mannose 6-dehydrogenase